MAEEVLTTGFAIAWPWLLVLVPLPWLLRLLIPASSSGDLQALRVPWFSAVAGGKAGFMRRPWLALVAALVGLDRLQEIYRIAIAEQYRFYSYGDAMLILP